MMKFVLISIAVILAGLGIYTYSNQTTEKSHSTPITISQKKEVVQKVEKPLAVTPEETKKKSSAKNIMVKSPKVVSKEPNEEMVGMGKSLNAGKMQDSMADYSEIGKGLTLEGIKNSDASKEEKDRMLDDLAAYQSYRNRNNPSISEEEGIKALTNSFN